MKLSEFFPSAGNSSSGFSWDDTPGDETLLLNCNGTNGSTTFTDESLSAHVFTAGGNAQLATADQKFGSASLLLDGVGDYITTPYVAADFNFEAEDYTLDLWVKASSWTGWSYLYVGAYQLPTLIGQKDPTTNHYWSFGPDINGKLVFYYWTGALNLLMSSATVPLNQWNHISLNIIGTSIFGTLNGTVVFLGNLASGVLHAGSFTIGAAGSTYLAGNLDAIRVTKGRSRLIPDMSFDVPTAEPSV